MLSPRHDDPSLPSSPNPVLDPGRLLEVFKLSSAPVNDKLEYLFEDEYVPNGPSWGARICYGAGTSYLVGLGVGGVWGLAKGLTNPLGRGSARLRWNCIVNACTAKGPFVANGLGMVALLYNLVHGATIKARGDRVDAAGSIASATLAGALFKSTAGLPRCAAGASLAGGAMALYQAASYYYHNRRQ